MPHAVFDPARTSGDPYDERPGPWYDMAKVREIEAMTGLSFDGSADESHYDAASLHWLVDNVAKINATESRIDVARTAFEAGQSRLIRQLAKPRMPLTGTETDREFVEILSRFDADDWDYHEGQRFVEIALRLVREAKDVDVGEATRRA